MAVDNEIQNFISDFLQQIEQKPQNKDELMVSNSVLKLAADLLKVRGASKLVKSFRF